MMNVIVQKSSVAPRAKRRTAVVAVAAVLVLLLSACLTADQSTATRAVDADRTANRVPALNTYQQAQAKAQAWANKLARENRLYHSTLTEDITDCWSNLGEKVAYSGSIQAAQNQFMASSGHRADVVSRTWNGVGVGVAKNGNRVFVVQVFIKTC